MNFQISKNPFCPDNQKNQKSLKYFKTCHIQAVQDAGQTLIEATESQGEEIVERMRQLTHVWEELKHMAASRGRKLDESITYQKFLAKIEEEESWYTLDTMFFNIISSPWYF
jgi:hypothetical protein